METDPLRVKPKQKRSRMRVDAILNAASDVFAEVGYEKATIIEIAARADTSIGSLYQFFKNKEAILKALVERYADRASEVFAEMDVEAFPAMTLEQSIKTVLEPLKAFIQDNRDFQVIFATSTGSTLVAEIIQPMDDAFQARTDAALAQTYPNLSPQHRRKYSLVCMVIMKALLGLAHHSSELTLDEVFEEMEAVYLRYLTPVMKSSHVD